jgi:hypothetical protein
MKVSPKVFEESWHESMPHLFRPRDGTCPLQPAKTDMSALTDNQIAERIKACEDPLYRVTLRELIALRAAHFPPLVGRKR